jgi:hypothetical protein
MYIITFNPVYVFVLISYNIHSLPIILFLVYFFLPHEPNVVPNGAITINAPPTIFPNVTGIRFFVIMSIIVIGAPRKIPNGNINILATLCSNPNATNADIGNQTAAFIIHHIMEIHIDKIAGYG